MLRRINAVLYAEAIVSAAAWIPTGQGVDAVGAYRLRGVPFTVIHDYGNADATLGQLFSHPPIINIVLNHICWFAIVAVAWLVYRRLRKA